MLIHLYTGSDASNIGSYRSYIQLEVNKDYIFLNIWPLYTTEWIWNKPTDVIEMQTVIFKLMDFTKLWWSQFQNHFLRLKSILTKWHTYNFFNDWRQTICSKWMPEVWNPLTQMDLLYAAPFICCFFSVFLPSVTEKPPFCVAIRCFTEFPHLAVSMG